MVQVSTSILNIDENNSVKTFYNLEMAKTDYFHIDVMDGKFVENNTSNKMWNFTNEIKNISNIPLDVHLMVEDVMEYINEYIPLEPCFITIHKEVFETTEDLIEMIKYIKNEGVKVGVAVNPNTNVNEILQVLEFVNLILIMTVEPGNGGQILIPETLEKIEFLKEYRRKNNMNFYIEADGGINLETVGNVKKSGADIIVSGTAIIKSEDYKQRIKELKE